MHAGVWRTAALFLDLDGTLVPIRDDPSAVAMADDTRVLLRRLQRHLDGALAVVSGRPVEQIDRIVGLPALAAAGLHGHVRRRADGTQVMHGDRDALAQVRPALTRVAERYQGARIEDKTAAIAVHYRGRPELREPIVSEVRAHVAPLGERVTVLDGKMVCEVKPRGVDKGTAIRAFMGEPPFAGRWPTFVGDDVSDEDGFDAVNALGGLSVRVGHAATVAHDRLTGPSAVAAWLEGLADALEA